jgi:crossover junction endodeoxyribonuclease RusA
VTEPIRFTVYGVAQPQGNKSGFVNKKTGGVVMREGSSGKARDTFKDWRGAVADAARAWQADHESALLDEPVRLEAEFYLPRPAANPWRLWQRGRPDVDKLARAILDALTGIVFVDDGRVVELYVSKPFAGASPPRAVITVQPLGHLEEQRRESMRRRPKAGAA